MQLPHNILFRINSKLTLTEAHDTRYYFSVLVCDLNQRPRHCSTTKTSCSLSCHLWTGIPPPANDLDHQVLPGFARETRNRKLPLCRPFNPFSTAVPIWGQPSLISSDLSPKRDWGPKGVNLSTNEMSLGNGSEKEGLWF